MSVVDTRIALLFGLALALARAEPSASAAASEMAPRRKSVAASAEIAAVPADEIIDLDFADDFPVKPSRPARPEVKTKAATRAPGSRAVAQADVEAKAVPVPARVEAAPEPSRAWMYWAMGIATLAGAAGGTVWYFHADESRSVEPVRHRQAFTDAKD